MHSIEFNVKTKRLTARKTKRNPLVRRGRFCLLSATLLFNATLVLTGCNDANVKKLVKIAIKDDESKSVEQYCQSKSVPFEHSLCTISQSNLSKSKSPLSLKLFWKSGKWKMDGAPFDIDKTLKPLYTFDQLIEDLESDTQLKFATNAGMYNREFAPIGYTVINGQQILSLNLNQGAGNFHMMPNGVLWWDKAGKVYITESNTLHTMLDNKVARPLYATQSGPMLIIDGMIHPKFNPNSASKKIRNGVGVCDDGNVSFVTSSELVNFYQFAHYFKEQLNCPNALFLDGGVASALYAPDINKKDDKNMGVMIGLIENKVVEDNLLESKTDAN